MKDHQERLINQLLEKNDRLSYSLARTWIELLWDDFETTQAKAGRNYLGSDMTERIVQQWIENYGSRLDEFVANNPKYKHFLNQENN
ncbi:MAG: YfhJ family protein [Neobacillus sp.]|jgi:hypothetical protein